MFEITIISLEVHVLYMGKRKPKLDILEFSGVSQKSHFSFY